MLIFFTVLIGTLSFQAYALPTTVIATTDKCFAMADNAAKLYSFDLDINTPPTSTNTTQILNGEGATYRATDNSVYTFHQSGIQGVDKPSDLYRVDLAGNATLIKANFLSEQGVGAEFVHYSDGTEHLVVLLREYDSRIEIYNAQDLTNSTPLSSLPLFFPNSSPAKVDGLAINPNTGEVLVVDDADTDTDYPEIYSVNMSTGQLTLKVTLNIPGIDAESLAFAEDGNVYLENEGWGATSVQNKIFRVNLSTGALTAVEENIDAIISGDIEGMSCTGSKIITNTGGTTADISGTIFEDINYGGGVGRSYSTANTSYAATNVGTEATVELWASNGSSCTGIAPLQSTTSNAFDGSYSFNSITGSTFCVRVVNNVAYNLSTINAGNNAIPVQTYRTESTSGTGSLTSIINEVGGRSPRDADVNATTFDAISGDGSTSQSWSIVNITGGDVSGIDFGFNFNTIVNTNDTGQGSLRQFIINANTIGNETNLAQVGQTAGREVSIFMLPNGSNYAGMKAAAGNVFSTNVATINLQSELPSIDRSYVDLDASTQINSNCPTPLIELNGVAAGTAVSNLNANGQGTSGLTIRRDHHIIRGFIINRFASSGIELFRDAYPTVNDSSDNTHIKCNWIGLDKTGNNAQGNGEWGIALWGKGSFVGDDTVTGRNIISGNTLDGIMNGGSGSLDNTLHGNYIGTNAAGTAAVGNGRHGIQYYNTHGTSAGNVALIKGNTIAYNGLSGIGIARTTPKAHNIHVSQNSIFSNAELGIDLVGSGASGAISDGVTLNDINDVDSSTSANGLQNFPVITSALKQGTDVEVSGTLNSLANKDYEIELYSNQTCNANLSGTASAEAYGEGENYVTTLSITTNASGNGNFTATLPYASLTGDYLTSLASNSTSGDTEQGNTSEFSACALAATCNALSGELIITSKTNASIKENDAFFITSTSITANNREGHLRSYPLTANGVPSMTANWDAASAMTENARDTQLYSSDSSNTLTLFNNIDPIMFASSTPDAATIKNYTIVPSYGSSVYLAGRRYDSLLGAISPDSPITLLTQTVDTLTYMNDSAYRTFFTNTIKNRDERVLFSSDDGFLYAINTNDGTLSWGWMPPSLIPELKNYATFQDQHWMKGLINVVDLKDSTGDYASYVVGSYKKGLGHYVLKLDANGNLANVIWDHDATLTNSDAVSSPNQGQAAYFSNTANNKTYSASIINNADGSSFLTIRNLTDTSVNFTIPLSYTATSVPYVASNLSHDPTKKTLYLGDNNGNIYSADLLLSDGTLATQNAISTAINGSAVAAMHTANSSPVLFISAVTSASDKGYYLRAQAQDRLTLFKKPLSNWQRSWTTTIGDAGKWTNGTNYTADANIQALPTGAQISAQAYTVANSIVLPVTTEPTGSNCYRNAHYYLYKLTDGNFPSKTFYNVDKTEITTLIDLGKGEAKRLDLSDFASASTLVGFGTADQKADSATSLSKAIYIHEGFTTGIRSWRELR